MFPEVGLPVVYDGVQLEVGYRIDLLVEDVLIVELKSVERLAAVHKAQLLTYLEASKKRGWAAAKFQHRPFAAGNREDS